MRVERDTIGNVVDVIPSNVDKVIRENETLIRLCNYMDVYNNRYLTNTIDYNSGSVSIQELVKFSLRPNDVIITKDSETPEDIAVPGVVVEEVDSLICGYHLALLRPKENKIDGQFLMHLLQLDEVKKQFSIKANGSTRYGLTIDSIKSIKIKFPTSLVAQRKIAKILRTVDGQIEKTEAIIAKYKAIKQGLMQDLFTRGIDVPTGKLRPRYQEAPELYKPSPLGMIPKEWSDPVIMEKSIEKVIDFRGKTPLKIGMEWGDGEIPALSANNVVMGKIDFTKENYFGSEALYNKWMNNGDCEPDDVLFTMEAPLGNVARIPDNRKYILSQRVILLRPKKEYSKRFYFYYLQSRAFQENIQRESTGSTATGIQRAKLFKIYIPLLDTKEQTVISEKLAAIDSSILSEEQQLGKLNKLKKGLMSDLLSGKVRVQVDEEAIC